MFIFFFHFFMFLIIFSLNSTTNTYFHPLLTFLFTLNHTILFPFPSTPPSPSTFAQCTNLYLGEAYDTTNLPFHDGRHHPHPPLRCAMPPHSPSAANNHAPTQTSTSTRFHFYFLFVLVFINLSLDLFIFLFFNCNLLLVLFIV